MCVLGHFGAPTTNNLLPTTLLKPLKIQLNKSKQNSLYTGIIVQLKMHSGFVVSLQHGLSERSVIGLEGTQTVSFHQSHLRARRLSLSEGNSSHTYCLKMLLLYFKINTK